MRDLIARIEAATGPDREIDRDIALCSGWQRRWADDERKPGWLWRRGDNSWFHGDSEVPYFTASLDAALTLVPDGCAVIVGRGRLTPSEPLYGAQVFAGLSDAAKIGESETDGGMALALCAAALRARLAMQEAGDDPA